MYSKDLQERIKQSYEAIGSYRAVGRIFKVHHNTVKAVVSGTHLADKSHTGRPKKTTQRDESNIKRAVAQIKQTGARVTARKVRDEANLHAISKRTVQRRLKGRGLVYRKADVKIVHTKAHKETRLNFSRESLKYLA